MIEFRLTMEGLEVRSISRFPDKSVVVGHIDKNGFFTGPVHLLEHVRLSVRDLREITDRTELFVSRGH